MAISNNRISNLIETQVPFFVRNDHETFVRFLEAYYEFLEQEDQVVNSIKEIGTYQNVDLTVDTFSEHLYATFLKLIPTDAIVDKDLILKNIKDFYRSRGTEKAARFLMRILFGEEIEFYYPKKDILRASDGKWYIQKSLRITDTRVDDVLDDSLTALEHYIGTQITGSSSGTTALIERVDRFYEQGTLIDELILSNIDGTFENGEIISATWNDVESVRDISSNIFSGIINTITITNAGASYEIGDPVVVLSNTGAGACAYVAQVSTGNIASLTVFESMGGVGYRANDDVLAVGGGGSGFSGNVALVDYENELFHPNTYNLVASTIELEAGTAIGNAKYSNLNSSISDPANNWISNSMSYWLFSNTGPILVIAVSNPGSGYTSLPSFSVSANNKIKTLGILGKMEINDGGTGYAIGDKIEFINPYGSYGNGASGNVTNVDGSGTITAVRFKQVPGHITGGAGYNPLILPTANVISGTGSGANVEVKALLGYGASLVTANSVIGAIERIIITSRGVGYENASIDLTGSGNGLANANVSIISGVYTYPGRYLNDDGHLSSYNFLENRDYYQNFSYVIKIKKDIDKYREAAKLLIHPAGMKLFGEYTSIDQLENFAAGADSNTLEKLIVVDSTLTWQNTSNAWWNPTIYYPSHGLSVGDTITLEFTAGNVHNDAMTYSYYQPNAFYRVANVLNTNAFVVCGGKYLQGTINSRTLYAESGLVGLQWKPDGTSVFIYGTDTDRIYEWNVAKPWDLTTISGNTGLRRSPSFASRETSAQGFRFKPDGSLVYVWGATIDCVLQYTLTENWNVNTAVYNISSQNVYADKNEAIFTGFNLSPNGDYMYLTGMGNDIIYQYTLSEPWNVNTASYMTEKYVGAHVPQPGEIEFNDSGNTLFVWDTSVDKLFTYSLSTAWNVNTAVHTANSMWNSTNASSHQFASDAGMFSWRPDGLMFYITDNQNLHELITQVPVMQAWNANTVLVKTQASVENVLVGFYTT